MSLSPGNKGDDSFNFSLQKIIARWEPSFSKSSGPEMFCNISAVNIWQISQANACTGDF